MSFEESLAKVESIVKSLSSGDTELEEAIKLYKEGTEELEKCFRSLEAAKAQTLKVETEEADQ